MNLRAFTEQELDTIGMTVDSDKMNVSMRNHILNMVDEFENYGHSGSSAQYAIAVLNKVLRYEPLAPLTGEDNEWIEIHGSSEDGPLFQNKRCSRVFKDKNGAYDIDGKIFVDSDGYGYTSRTPVVFPYTPHTEYVNRSEA